MKKILGTLGVLAWIAGCAGSHTRAVVVTPTQAAAIREILRDQLPKCPAKYFAGSQRADGQIVMAVGCK